jgi:hypothetical protein
MCLLFGAAALVVSLNFGAGLGSISLLAFKQQDLLLLLSNDYRIVQTKGVGIIQFLFFYLNNGFVIKSNELSINSISKR